MAKLKLCRGEKSKVEKLPLNDGQVSIGTILDKTAAIYIDTLDKDGKTIRVSIDFTDYIKRIEELEASVELIKNSISDASLYTILQTNDGANIVTNNNETIVCNNE